MAYKNIEDRRRWQRRYREKNREKRNQQERERRTNDPEFRERCNEASRKYLKKQRDNLEFKERQKEINRKHNKKRMANLEYREWQKEYMRKRRAFVRLHFPWIFHWGNAHQRCNNPTASNYKYYGAKGIRMLLTKNQMEILWIRDKAGEMENPTVDRINPKDDYHFGNCRFLERTENIKRANQMRERRKCHERESISDHH